MQRTDFGVIGLAVMGRSLALNMADHGFKVGGYNRSREVTETLMREHPHENLIPFYDLKELVDSQERPRKFLIMVKAGKPVDMVIDQLLPLLDEGDMILDGGNSFFEDTRRREKELKEKGIYYFGTGVSGGEMGARFGPSISRAVIKRPMSILRRFWKKLQQKRRENHVVPIWGRTERDIM